MGISGRRELLICPDAHRKLPLPVIRRFSGGGTVVVDRDTLFCTLICNQQEVGIPPFPCKIMQWTAQLYAFIEGSQLCENDLTIQSLKFGGSAQYLCKNRWLHHTSLLWDFREEHMNLLKIPPRQPEYRQQRPHADFLCKLNQLLTHREELFIGLRRALKSRFHLEELPVEKLTPLLNRPHRRATALCGDLLPY